MDHTHPFRDLPDYAARLIRWKAKRLVGHYGLRHCDRDDIEQELAMFLWPRLGKFDPEKGQLKPFIDHVIKKGIATLVKHRLAQMRDYHREECSLNAPVRDVDGDEAQRGARMDENDGARRLGRTARHFTDQSDLALDLEEAISRLPIDLGRLCEHLRIDLPAEVSRKTDTPAGTLYDRRKEVQQLFEDRGLKEYFGKD